VLTEQIKLQIQTLNTERCDITHVLLTTPLATRGGLSCKYQTNLFTLHAVSFPSDQTAVDIDRFMHDNSEIYGILANTRQTELAFSSSIKKISQLFFTILLQYFIRRNVDFVSNSFFLLADYPYLNSHRVKFFQREVFSSFSCLRVHIRQPTRYFLILFQLLQNLTFEFEIWLLVSRSEAPSLQSEYWTLSFVAILSYFSWTLSRTGG
jgi:hypothetical protein